MKLKSYSLIFIFLISITRFSSTATAWPPSIHDYMCPEDYSIDCRIADDLNFQKNYPYGNHAYHLCMDNKTDGMPRLIAKYYVKKYYVEGEKDDNLLGAAAHLLQDASCPDHWYPTLKIFGHVVVPFAPSWVGTIENKVESYLKSGEKNWNIPIEFQGKTVNVNTNYLDRQREYIQDFLSKEPEESLRVIEKQVESKAIWHNLRIFQEWVKIGIILTSPFLLYNVWKLKRKTIKKKTEFIETIILLLALVIFTSLLLLTHLFY